MSCDGDIVIKGIFFTQVKSAYLTRTPASNVLVQTDIQNQVTLVFLLQLLEEQNGG